MKKFLIGMMLLGSLSSISQAQVAYEDLPDCFFKADSVHVDKHDLLISRNVGVDTCDTGDLISPWPTPVNGGASIGAASFNLDEMISRNKIFSNVVLNIKFDNEFEISGLIEAKTENTKTVQITVDDVLSEYKTLIDELNSELSQIADVQINLYDFVEISTNKYLPKKMYLQFDKYVSYKEVKSILNQKNLDTDVDLESRDFVLLPPVSVEDHDNTKSDFIVTNKYIQIQEISKPGIFKIFNLTGELIKETGLTLNSSTQVDISDLKDGLYFIVFNNSFHKFIKRSI